MDFSISEKMQTILGMIDEFVEKELFPLEPEFLTTPSRNLIPTIEAKRKLVKKMELWAPNHPREYGGMGLNLVEHALVSEALGRTPLGHLVFGCQAPDARHRMPETLKSFINTVPMRRKKNICDPPSRVKSGAVFP